LGITDCHGAYIKLRFTLKGINFITAIFFRVNKIQKDISFTLLKLSEARGIRIQLETLEAII
jgi:hypothetical protein